MISFGMDASGPILKLLRERCVCAPQYLSAGTCTSPMVSCSVLKLISINFAGAKLGVYVMDIKPGAGNLFSTKYMVAHRAPHAPPVFYICLIIKNLHL